MDGPVGQARQEPAAVTARPAARAAIGATSTPTTLHARALALQRAAGNAAVAALAKQRSVERAPKRTIQRRRAAPRPPSQRNPPWAAKGINNPDADCTPIGTQHDEHDAKAAWDIYAAVLPDKITARCGGCALVGDAYAEFLEAKGTRHTYKDDGNCISEQLAQDEAAHAGDKTHVGPEERLLERWKSWRPAIVWYELSGTKREIEIDLIEALKGSIQPAVPDKLTEMEISNQLTYRRNTLAGGLLFGGGTADHIEPDSEFGFDTRHVSGTIKITRTDDGSSQDFMAVDEVLTFRYRIHDALDFCPGNTLRKDDWSLDSLAYNIVLSDLSRLEATGMARDVEFTVFYHRTKTMTAGVYRPKW